MTCGGCDDVNRKANIKGTRWNKVVMSLVSNRSSSQRGIERLLNYDAWHNKLRCCQNATHGSMMTSVKWRLQRKLNEKGGDVINPMLRF